MIVYIATLASAGTIGVVGFLSWTRPLEALFVALAAGLTVLGIALLSGSAL